MRRYECDLADMGMRNSLAKTDRDAIFMRMKEDHMKNGQPKAGYNVQNGTENQFAVHVSVHQRPGDTACMKPHLDSLKRAIGHLLRDIVTDAGYGSEENYEYLESEGSRAFVKHQMFYKEQKRTFKNDPAQPANWTYDRKADEWECAGRRKLTFLYEHEKESSLGYRSKVRVYRCGDCKGCKHIPACLRDAPEGKSRRIHVNHRYTELKRLASERLSSEEGIKLRKRRATDVETVLGDVKRNWNFKRFTLRGLKKVTHERRLLMMGHNLRKLTRTLTKSKEKETRALAGA